LGNSTRSSEHILRRCEQAAKLCIVFEGRAILLAATVDASAIASSPHGEAKQTVSTDGTRRPALRV